MREKLRFNFGKKTILFSILSFFTSSVQEENASWEKSKSNTHFDKKVHLYIYSIKKVFFSLWVAQKGIPIYNTTFKQRIRFFNKDDFSLDPLLV